ncbi:hypothetical protein P4S95_01380 [Aneurinibacillus aneurinilyticus]|nr:hypothetical protein [Aneurinibacillus aneurinilyticus]
MIMHISEEIRCMHRRVPSSFSHKEGTRCGDEPLLKEIFFLFVKMIIF